MSEQNAGLDHWLITGASSGIGAATTALVCGAGHAVLALDVDAEKGQQLAQRTGATFQHCDVSQIQAWQNVVETLRADDKPFPNRIFLNAGIQIAPPDAPLSEYEFAALKEDRYRRMMGVNVDGVVFGLHALLPHMSAGSAVVVTCSLAGITPYSVDPLYSMSKHAVTGLVRSLAPVVADKGMRINAICPGGIDTAIIPAAQRTADAQFMPPESIAEEAVRLMQVPENGKTWAKVSVNKAAFIVRAPGDRG